MQPDRLRGPEGPAKEGSFEHGTRVVKGEREPQRQRSPGKRSSVRHVPGEQHEPLSPSYIFLVSAPPPRGNLGDTRF